jgi:hypothetical protein
MTGTLTHVWSPLYDIPRGFPSSRDCPPVAEFVVASHCGTVAACQWHRCRAALGHPPRHAVPPAAAVHGEGTVVSSLHHLLLDSSNDWTSGHLLLCTSCNPQGALRDQLLYPRLLPDTHTSSQRPRGNDDAASLIDDVAAPTAPAAPPSDDELAGILVRLQLGHLLLDGSGGLDAIEDWDTMLSVGEQQRIAFARLFTHR